MAGLFPKELQWQLDALLETRSLAGWLQTCA